MKLLRIFSICSGNILSMDHCTDGTVTAVQRSCLHVIKKPVRLFVNENNTLFSHYITFCYTVNSISYAGKLFVDVNYRCPQVGETISVYFDPEKPENYACYAFGPAVRPIGW